MFLFLEKKVQNMTDDTEKKVVKAVPRLACWFAKHLLV